MVTLKNFINSGDLKLHELTLILKINSGKRRTS